MLMLVHLIPIRPIPVASATPRNGRPVDDKALVAYTADA
jgi:hypothetical protein